MEEYVKQNTMAYDSTAYEYDIKTNELRPQEIEKREYFLDLVKKGIKKDAKKAQDRRTAKKAAIIDIGCGPGRDAKIFSGKGFDVTGIDISEEMLNRARTAAPSARFSRMDFQKICLPDKSVDGAWFEAGIICIQKDDAKTVLANIYRILKSGGILYISAKEGTTEGLEYDSRYNVNKFYAYYTEDELGALLERCGFEIVKAKKIKIRSAYHKHRWINLFCRKP
ncbi:class I SAM-dependent methyltransferase [Candidatus Woesearchaeota archaeon]|nr:class I SAM-dependent methyltransferase [Candidatus Woesearchaeota archaeon]